MNTTPSKLAELLQIDTPIVVVDVGANPIDGEPPYRSLLDAGLTKVFGFEPNPEALARLNSMKGPDETYFPHALFDGTERELKVCKAPEMTSLLEPNPDLLKFMHGFSDWGAVVERKSIPTERLDDVTGLEKIDYLKLDIQGGELEVCRNGTNRLQDCLVIHTEVEFLPMYQGQPLFSEVELFLREQGFIFHRFAPLVSRAVKPMLVNDNIYDGLSQVFWANAVFIRDFSNFDQLGSEALKKTALILHEIYQSYDISLRALITLDERYGLNLVDKYRELLIRSGFF